jgi:hypothetical protein
MLDSKTHSRAGTQEPPLCENDISWHLSAAGPKKVAIQLSIFPTATLTFVILVQEKKSQCTWHT